MAIYYEVYKSYDHEVAYSTACQMRLSSPVPRSPTLILRMRTFCYVAGLAWRMAWVGL